MVTNRNRGLASLALGLLVISFLAGCTPPGPRALLEGERLIQQGEYAKAVQKLELATQILSRNAQAWNHLGVALQSAGQPASAFRAYRKALALDPGLVPVRYNLGCYFLEQNQVRAAIGELTTFTRQAGSSYLGWLKLGEALLRGGDIAAAEKSLRNAIELKPDLPEAHNNLGIALLQRRQPRGASNEFVTALRLQSNYPPALLNLAVVAQTVLKRPPLALELYQRYVALTPAPPKVEAVRRMIRLLATAAHRPPPSAGPPSPQVSEASHPARPESKVETTVASATLTAPHPKPASNPPRTVPQPAKPTPQPAPARTSTAPTPRRATNPHLTKAGKPPATPSVHAPLEKHAPSTSPPTVEVVHLHQATPPKVGTKVPVASAPFSRPRPEKRAASPGNPGPSKRARHPPAVPSASGTVLARLNPGNWFRSAAKPPTPLDQRTTLANGELAPSSPPRATGSTPTAPPSSPERFAPLSGRYTYHAFGRLQRGDRQAALPYFQSGVRANQRHQWDQAARDFEKAARLDPSFFEAQYDLGISAAAAGELSLALLAYERALQVQPESVSARYNFALTLMRTNYLQDAANELEKLLNRHPDEVRAQLTLANLYAQRLYLYEKAASHYRAVLKLDPHYPSAPQIRSWLANHP